MLNSSKPLLLFCLSLLLTACSSPKQIYFYQLKSIDPQPIQLQADIAEKIVLSVSNIKFPDYLDRPQLLIRDGDYKLLINDLHRWISPLKNEFTRVLLINLNEQLSPFISVRTSDPDASKTKIKLSVEVLQLDVDSQEQATLTVKWAFTTTDHKQKTFRGQQKYQAEIENKSYPSRVAALSRTIALFSEEISSFIHTTYPQIFSKPHD